MAIGGISNSHGTQSNLTALANTQQLLRQAEQHLATGKAVSSPADNTTAYYAAQSLTQQAGDLIGVKDNLSTALTTVSSTTDSLSSVTKVVQQLQGITTQAASTTDPTTRANLASQYNALLPQLDQLVNDSNFNGTNLMNNNSNSLNVYFNASNTSSLTISGVDVTSGGLGINAAPNGFASNADINAANTQLSNALSTLNTTAANFGENATVIQTNQDLTSNLINNLQGAADNLTAADPNQEAANILALQAQNQLGIVSLSISSTLSQSILKIL